MARVEVLMRRHGRWYNRANSANLQAQAASLGHAAKSYLMSDDLPTPPQGPVPLTRKIMPPLSA